MPLLSRNPTPGELTVAEAHERVHTARATLLDVCEADKYTAGHAPGAVRQPPAAHAAGAPLPEGAGDCPVLTVCRAENRSREAAELLSHRGVRAVNVSGGMRAWAIAGLPVHTGSGRGGHAI
ncbi:rhodanese-like domain-containing protein [Streptomyces sp. NPDC058864]